MTPTPNQPKQINERLALSILALVQFTHIMDFMIMMPLGSHLMRVFAISPEQFSHLVAAYGLSAGVFGFAGGFILDRFERKHALLVLYTGFSLATLGCALAPNYAFLLLARVLAGACGGVAGSVVVAMVSDMVPPERRGRAMGYVMSAFPLASVLGVPCGLWLAGKYEWHAPFFMLAGTSLVILMIALRALPHVHSHLSTAHPWKQMQAILTHRIHQRGFLLSAVLVFAGACVVPFMAPSMVDNVGLKEENLFEIYLCGGVATFISTFVIGRLTDRHDKLHVLAAVSGIAIITVYFVTRMTPGPLYISLFITSMFFVSMAGRFAPAMGMISIAVEPRYRGGFMSVNAAIQQLSSGAANLVAGLLVTKDAVGHLVGFPNTGFLSIAGFVGTLAVAWWLRSAAPHAAKPIARRPSLTKPAIAAVSE